MPSCAGALGLQNPDLLLQFTHNVCTHEVAVIHIKASYTSP